VDDKKQSNFDEGLVMKVFVYAIYDSAAGTYRQPMFLQQDGIATRVFKDLCMNAETDLAKHPKDFTLFRIGTFDDQKGELDGETPVSMATAQEIIHASQQIQPGSLKEIPGNSKEHFYSDSNLSTE
jgi:hypothetical protein